MDIISQEQAEELFRVFLSDERINWGLTQEDCKAKADLLAEVATNKNVRVSKIWALPREGNTLRMYLNRSETESVDWNYHVAVATQVSTDGGSTAVVLDPSLFQRPVELERWEGRFRNYNDHCRFEVSDINAYHGPDDVGIEGLREIVIRERDEVLASAHDSRYLDVAAGHELIERGRFVDALETADPDSHLQLKHLISETRFGDTWLSYFTAGAIVAILDESGSWMSVPAMQVKQHLRGDHVGLNVKVNHWQAIASHVERLSLRYGQLRSSESKLARSFQRECLEVEFVDNWFSPSGYLLWEKYQL